MRYLRVGRAFTKAGELLMEHVADPLFGRTCPVCGKRAMLSEQPGKLADDLARGWELDATSIHRIERRECTICRACRTRLRSIHIAHELIRTLNARFALNARCLDELLADPRVRQLKVAEINSIGDLHPRLAVLPHLVYSEYASTVPGVPDEDLSRLSYADGSFDLVLTSETLEHVPDVDRALAEIRRILKPDGLHLFTVPIILAKPVSRQRAAIVDGRLQHLLPPTYHGDQSAKASDFLVFSEFGRDFIDRVRAAGFEVDLRVDERNEALVVFIARRVDAGQEAGDRR